MKIIVDSVYTIINHLPHAIKELCSQFMFEVIGNERVPTNFEANVNIDDLEDLGFTYIYFDDDGVTLKIRTESDELEVYLDELNYDYDNSNTWDEQVEYAVNGDGVFHDAVIKIRAELVKKGRANYDYDQIVNLIADNIDINCDKYEIICIRCCSGLYERISD